MAAVQRESRSILSSIASDWISVIEPHACANLRHSSGGALVMCGFHAVVFGHGIEERAEAAVRKQRHRLQSRFQDVSSLKLKWIGPTDLDLTRVAYYPWKPPVRSKTLYLNGKTGKANLHESEAGDRYVRFLRMIQIRAMISVDSIVYGGGRGQSIRSDSLRAAKGLLQAGVSEREPPIHSDELGRHIAEFGPRIGRPDFRLPVVRRRRK